MLCMLLDISTVNIIPSLFLIFYVCDTLFLIDEAKRFHNAPIYSPILIGVLTSSIQFVMDIEFHVRKRIYLIYSYDIRMHIDIPYTNLKSRANT